MLGTRLKTIASFIDSEDEVIDVGCDHALLDIYLTLYNHNKCLATDISEGALKQAKSNIYHYGLTGQIKVQVGNGLQNIQNLKDKVIVIAGMGTETILEILNDDRIYEAKCIVISTHTELRLLRRKMVQKDFKIVEEKVALENYKFYVVIKFVKGRKRYTARECYLGPILKDDPSYEVMRYYESLYYENINILKKIPDRYIQKRKPFLKNRDWILEIIGKKLGPHHWK